MNAAVSSAFGADGGPGPRKVRRPSQRASLLIAAALAGCGSIAAAQLPPSLEQVLVFADPAACEYGEPLGQIFAGLAVWDDAMQASRAGAPFRVSGLSQTLIPRLTRQPDGYVRIHAPLRGRWHGLTVTGVETVFLPETDDIVSRILFAAPLARLIEVAHAQGFRLDPRTGEMLTAHRGGAPESSIFLSAERYRGGSALSCSGG